MDDSELHIKKEGARIHIEGPLDIHHFRQAKDALSKLLNNKATIDLAKVTRLDTAGALVLKNSAGQHLRLENLRPEHKALFDLVSEVSLTKLSAKKPLPAWKQAVMHIGKATMGAWHATAEFISFMGQSVIGLAKTARHPSTLRFNSVMHHIKAVGIDAIPLISIIAFVISVVIAYQGQVQLRPLGVQQYTINLIAISILREMGVLLTAIMVAGRSGSNFTAEIGVMKVRQEVDALKSMGFDPFELLVLPRLIALLIVLPLLTLLADIMGLLGGAVISMSLMDIGLPEYLERARSAISYDDFVVGMIKAPVFALVIGLVGCMHGLKVSGSSESVGKETTVSVVKSIFLILMLDGLFSIYFQKVGL